MPVELNHQIENRYLKVELYGERTEGNEAEEGIGIWKKTTDLCEALKLNRILVHSKIEGRLPPTDIFEIAEAIDKYSWEKEFKIAGVASNQMEHANLKFIENCASLLNFTIKIFTSETEAKKWLLK